MQIEHFKSSKNSHHYFYELKTSKTQEMQAFFTKVKFPVHNKAFERISQVKFLYKKDDFGKLN